MLNRDLPILFLLMILLIQGCVNIQTLPAAAGLQNTQAVEAEPVIYRSNNSSAAGSRVYRDPTTGEFTSPPPTEVKVPNASTSTREAISTEPSTMQEKAIQGGGTLIHLQGHFRNYMSATKDATGKVTIHCDDKSEMK